MMLYVRSLTRVLYFRLTARILAAVNPAKNHYRLFLGVVIIDEVDVELNLWSITPRLRTGRDIVPETATARKDKHLQVCARILTVDDIWHIHTHHSLVVTKWQGVIFSIILRGVLCICFDRDTETFQISFVICTEDDSATVRTWIHKKRVLRCCKIICKQTENFEKIFFLVTVFWIIIRLMKESNRK